MNCSESGAVMIAITIPVVSPDLSGNGPAPAHVLLNAQLIERSGSVSDHSVVRVFVVGLQSSRNSVSGPAAAAPFGRLVYRQLPGTQKLKPPPARGFAGLNRASSPA